MSPTVPINLRPLIHGLAQCGYSYARIASWLGVSKAAVYWAYRAHTKPKKPNPWRIIYRMKCPNCGDVDEWNGTMPGYTTCETCLKDLQGHIPMFHVRSVFVKTYVSPFPHYYS